MAQLPGAFNPNDHEEMANFEAMPVGDYNMKITDSKKVESNATKGNFYWKMEFTVQDGKYKGRKVWTNLNLINRNPDAVDIAQRELTSICKAAGTGPISDTEELHGKELICTLKVVPETPKYPASNAVSSYKRNPNLASAPKPDTEESGEEQMELGEGEMPWDDD